MNPVGTLNALGGMGLAAGSCLRPQRECTTQSIVKAMDNFLSAVQTMKETVMVPSCLQGIPLNQQVKPASAPAAKSGAIVPATNSATVVGNIQNIDMRGCYELVDLVGNELLSGEMLPNEKRLAIDDENCEKISSEKEEDQATVSSYVRQHLRGLFSALHQLTDIANSVTKQYQEQIEYH